MNTVALLLSLVSLSIVVGTWISYLRKIPRGEVAGWPRGSVILQWLGLGLAIGAVAWSVLREGRVGVAVLVPAAFSVMLGAFFLWLLAQRKTPIGDLKVKVGDALLPFAATTSEGTAFHTDELAGKRVLLKFFRGGW